MRSIRKLAALLPFSQATLGADADIAELSATKAFYNAQGGHVACLQVEVTRDMKARGLEGFRAEWRRE